MLDTNVLSQAIRDPLGVAARKIESRGIDRVCTSVLVAAELRYGVEKSGSARLRANVELALSGIAIMPLEHPADRIYADVRHQLMSVGTPIGPVDMFIAAHALLLDLTLVTANVGEFSRVPGLKVENWLD